jgi:hypothetical protein
MAVRTSLSPIMNLKTFAVRYSIRLHTGDGKPKRLVQDGEIVLFDDEKEARAAARGFLARYKTAKGEK